MPPTATKDKPCFRFKDTGRCRFGDDCAYSHDPSIVDTRCGTSLEHRPRSAAAGQSHDTEPGTSRREPEEQERRGHEAEERARRQREEEAAARALQGQKLEAQATETLQTVVSGAIVTFGAGLEVQHVVTGFECCRILIRNLPPDLRDMEITGLLAQHGLVQHNFRIMRRKYDRVQDRVEIAVCADAEAARPLLSGIPDLTLRGEPLNVELGVFNGIDGMDGGADGPSLLRLSFFAPSERLVATYPTAAAATKHFGRLQGKVLEGRSLRVSRGREDRTLVIDNVAIPYDNQVLTDLAGTIFLQALRTEVIDVDFTIRRIKRHVSATSSASHCEIQSHGRDGDGLVKLVISCPTWDIAKNIDDGIKQYILLGTLPSGIRTFLPPAMCFTMLIPSAQYHAQRIQWQRLRTRIKDRTVCQLDFRELNHGNHFVQVTGTEKRAVGMLKVQAERIASGVRVPGWHRSLTHPPPELFADVQAVGVYLHIDAWKAQIKLYGPTAAIDEASALVVAELDRLTRTQLTKIIPTVAAQFFAQKSVTQLRDILDNETVEYNPATRTLTATGGKDPLPAVLRLIEQGRNFIASNTTDDIVCQICFNTPSAPCTLPCDHAYCTRCLRHLFGSASYTSAFPLRCVGDNAQCTTLFSLAMTREFLSPKTFDSTLALAFSAHINSHSNDFRPCTTRDCKQIYRPQKTARALRCPSCYSTLCARCGQDGHDGMTCKKNRRMGNYKDEQERLTEVDTFVLADPFEDKGADVIDRDNVINQDVASQQNLIHIRFLQRDRRKTFTTLQGMPKKYNLKKLLRAFKKEFACNGTLVEDEELGQVIQLQGDQRLKISNFLVEENILKSTIKFSTL